MARLLQSESASLS